MDYVTSKVFIKLTESFREVLKKCMLTVLALSHKSIFDFCDLIKNKGERYMAEGSFNATGQKEGLSEKELMKMIIH